MKKSQFSKRYLPAFLAATLLTLLAISGLLTVLNNTLADHLYQRHGALTGEVILIGIDQRALEALGPWPWPRDLMAEALDYLNADPENRPAVIGVDVLFVGETQPASDAALAAAAGHYDNLITATAATFGSELQTMPEGTFYMDDYSVLAYDEPFPALRKVTEQGHINAMLDTDGILRHAIWQIDLKDGQKIPSFPQQIYRKYKTFLGEDATYVPPTDARHRFYVPLQALPGSFDDGFSVLDLISGSLDPSLFADKIVLIGPYAAGLQDSYYTSIDHAIPMHGVEFQANALSALLAGETKNELSSTPQLILLFALLLVALMWLRNRRVFSATLLWLSLSALWLLVCLSAYASGWVLQPLYIPLFLTVAYVASVAANYILERREKRRVTATFARYVAPEIVSELLRGDPKTLELGGKLCDIAVLFVDIRGFTTLSEGLDPRSVVEIINRYLTLTSTCIFQNGGTLDKYVGDCTMAIWGAPLPQENSISLAVKAAMDMVAGAQVLGQELSQQYGHSVSFGVGVHYGPAVVGNIGSPTRMDYTAIGDTVNTAARLEANAPPGQIFVSRVVADALEGQVHFTTLGDSIRLKGKSEGFEILRVEGLI